MIEVLFRTGEEDSQCWVVHNYNQHLPAYPRLSRLGGHALQTPALAACCSTTALKDSGSLQDVWQLPALLSHLSAKPALRSRVRGMVTKDPTSKNYAITAMHFSFGINLLSQLDAFKMDFSPVTFAVLWLTVTKLRACHNHVPSYSDTCCCQSKFRFNLLHNINVTSCHTK